MAEKKELWENLIIRMRGFGQGIPASALTEAYLLSDAELLVHSIPMKGKESEISAEILKIAQSIPAEFTATKDRLRKYALMIYDPEETALVGYKKTLEAIECWIDHYGVCPNEIPEELRLLGNQLIEECPVEKIPEVCDKLKKISPRVRGENCQPSCVVLVEYFEEIITDIKKKLPSES